MFLDVTFKRLASFVNIEVSLKIISIFTTKNKYKSKRNLMFLKFIIINTLLALLQRKLLTGTYQSETISVISFCYKKS